MVFKFHWQERCKFGYKEAQTRHTLTQACNSPKYIMVESAPQSAALIMYLVFALIISYRGCSSCQRFEQIKHRVSSETRCKDTDFFGKTFIFPKNI